MVNCKTISKFKMLTISDSIALKVLNEHTLIAGVGNEIRVFTNNGGYYVLCKLKGKVHGIEHEESSNKLLIYGEQEFVLLEQSVNSFQLLYRGILSDWISSAKILIEPGCFLLVTAHSVALLFRYYATTKLCEIQEKSSCTDKSTLYCSYVYGSTWDQSLILGGNAFGEVLIWQQSVRSPENPDKAKLLHRISSHNGVIFSIDLDMKSKLMVTTSDDRSIRFWDICTVEGDERHIDFEQSTFTPCKSGYSHVARVFKGKIVHECGEPYAITGGEDSYICVWNRNSELMFKRRQQFGATIWNLDYHGPTNTLFTSGSSGNLLKYNLQGCFQPQKTDGFVLPSESLGSTEYIAKIKFLNETNLVGITNKNRLMQRKGCKDEDWITVESFAPHKCTVLQAYEEYIAVAGHQLVTLYKFNKNSSYLEKIQDGVVLPGVIRSLIFLSPNEFLISDDSGNCKLVKSHNFNDYVAIDLPQCKERWVTAACKVNTRFIAISNRQGSIILFSVSMENNYSKACGAIKRLHGHLGATTITLVRDVASYSILKSSGHDGTLRTIKFDKELEQLSVVSREVIPIKWVEKTAICHTTSNEILFGFNDNHFVLWSREVDTHFQISCGGGHRCWDLNLQLDQNQVSVVFIKNKQVLLYTKSIFNTSPLQLEITRNKWHVKPCNVLSSFKGKKLFLVTGGDDNLLKISQYNASTATLTQLHEIYSHISSIRGLRMWSTSPGNYLIFSCGGRAQICVTEFREESQMFEELIDYSIQKEKPSQDIRFDPETRVMSIDIRQLAEDVFEVFTGCSDGYVRKFLMPSKSDLILVSEVFYGRCILHVRVAGNYLLTVATDGAVCFWKIDITDVVFKVAHHDSGVNSFDIRTVGESEFHLLTGGDDQQVVYSKVLQSADTFKVMALNRMDYLHTAQVTAVKFCPLMEHFYCSSVDQMVRRVDMKTFSSSWETFSCVADVKGIDLIQEDNGSRLVGFLYGCGVQLLDLRKCDL